MRQLAITELATVAGGNGDAIILGLGLGLGLGLIASTPSYGYYSSYPAYSYPTAYYYPPICDQYVTPVFDPYTGVYMGDMIDTYCY